MEYFTSVYETWYATTGFVAKVVDLLGIIPMSVLLGWMIISAIGKGYDELMLFLKHAWLPILIVVLIVGFYYAGQHGYQDTFLGKYLPKTSEIDVQ